MNPFRNYRNLFTLALVSSLSITAAVQGIISPQCAFLLIVAWQLIQFSLSGRRAICFIAALSEAQITEFQNLMASIKDYVAMFPKLKTILDTEGVEAALKALPENWKVEGKRVDELQEHIKKLRKQLASYQSAGSGVRYVGNVPFVTDDCAKALTSVLILEAAKLGEGAMRQITRDSNAQKTLIGMARGFLEVEEKTALDATTIPLPTIYMPQIVELVFKYGQARQYATVFPLGAGTVKLPRLKAGEDDFGFLGAGTGGMSQAITERRVTAELITFTANKAGGLIRIPTEIEEDTFIQLGQFLARYISRQLAKLEDKTLFLGDGTAAYANITGIGTYCINTPAYLQVLGAGKTKPTDATINDFRAMRAMVNAAVLANMAANGQTQAAYYLNPTLEALLVTFNTLNNPYIYVRQQGSSPATLDGFPIRWIGVSQAYSTQAQPGKFLAFFGDLSYWYLGERGSVRVELSKEVFFSTDELAMRALERVDVEAMAIDAMSALQTAAA
jgi:HK97 family phage major capsid protein